MTVEGAILVEESVDRAVGFVGGSGEESGGGDGETGAVGAGEELLSGADKVG